MNKRGLLYILENQVPIPTDDILQWGRWMEDPNNKRVASTEINGLRVSTLFLGVDNQFTEGQPVLFETIVFKKNQPIDEYCCRYYTWEEAKAGHDATLELIKTQKVDK